MLNFIRLVRASLVWLGLKVVIRFVLGLNYSGPCLAVEVATYGPNN